MDLEKLVKEDMADFHHLISEIDFSKKETYACWLAQTYEFASQTTRILAFAAAHLKDSEFIFFNSFCGHIAEETGHEKMLEKDLESLGYGLTDFEVFHDTKVLHQTQYYWMIKKNLLLLF